MSKSSQFAQSVSKSPFLWGILGSVGFYALILSIPKDAPGMAFVLRYFTHHPVEYMETVMFSVGLAALIVKVFEIAAQRAGTKKPRARAGDDAAANRGMQLLLDRLESLPGRRQGEYYIARLRAALEHVRRYGSAEGSTTN